MKKRSSDGIISFLITTIIVLVVLEVGLLFCIGVNIYQSYQAKEAAIAEYNEEMARRAANPPKVLYVGGPTRSASDESVELTPENDGPENTAAEPGPAFSAEPENSQPATPTNESTVARGRDFSGGRVLATTESNNNDDPVYHTQNCSAAKKIATESEYWYDSAKAAEEDGRRLCGICAR